MGSIFKEVRAGLLGAFKQTPEEGKGGISGRREMQKDRTARAKALRQGQAWEAENSDCTCVAAGEGC